MAGLFHHEIEKRQYFSVNILFHDFLLTEW